MPSAQPHEAMRRASDSVWVAIWRAFLQIAGIMEQPPHPSAGFGDAAAPVLSGELIL